MTRIQPIPYDPKDWLLLPPWVEPQRLADAAAHIFESDRPAVEWYTNIKRLNELFTWTRLEVPWPLEVFVRRHGIGKGDAAVPHKLVSIAALFDRSPRAIQTAYTNVLLDLRVARFSHSVAPRGHGINELRVLGLPPMIWGRLATANILSLDQLCAQTEANLLDIRHIGQDSCDLIKSLLRAQGRSLRPRR